MSNQSAVQKFSRAASVYSVSAIKIFVSANLSGRTDVARSTQGRGHKNKATVHNQRGTSDEDDKIACECIKRLNDEFGLAQSLAVFRGSPAFAPKENAAGRRVRNERARARRLFEARLFTAQRASI